MESTKPHTQWDDSIPLGKRFQVVFVRHGESTWNAENRFTGWYDCPLTEKGEKQAICGGKLLKRWMNQNNSRSNEAKFDLAFTSYQKRAIKTLWHILEQTDHMFIPIKNAWQLNERHYGGLEGQNKHEMREKYGEEVVTLWRRSYDIPPPFCLDDSPYHARNDPKYKDLPIAKDVAGESLKMTLERVIPYWEECIKPEILANKRIIISAHGNSLRALVKYLDHISDEDIPNLNIPMGVPLIYEFDEDMNVIPSSEALLPLQGKYLGNIEEIKKAIFKVKNQTK
eukprot:gene9107-9865_t